jgi:hypothetical protein
MGLEGSEEGPHVPYERPTQITRRKRVLSITQSGFVEPPICILEKPFEGHQSTKAAQQDDQDGTQLHQNLATTTTTQKPAASFFFFFFFSFCLSVRGHHHHHRHHYIRKSKVFSECERTRNNTHPSHSQSLSEYDDAHFDLHQRQRVEQKKQGKRSPVWRTNRGTMTTDFMAFLTGFLSTEGGLRESWTAI